LGNLALTCQYLQDEGRLDPADWELMSTTLTLKGDWKRTLKDAYAETFQLKDDVIYTPAFYRRGDEPDMPVRALIHRGLTQTVVSATNHVIGFHDKNTRYAVTSFDYDGKTVTCQYVRLKEFKKHTAVPRYIPAKEATKTRKAKPESWRKPRIDELIKRIEKGKMTEICCFEMPGTMTTHQEFKITEPCQEASLVLLLDMAHMGVLTVSGDSGCAAVYPQFDDLVEYVRIRPLMTPRSYGEFFTDGVSMAASTYFGLLDRGCRSIRECLVLEFGKTSWNQDQMLVKDSQSIDFARLDRGRRIKLSAALRCFPASMHENKKTGWYFKPSRLRSLVVRNIIEDRIWYDGLANVLLGQSVFLSNNDNKGIPMMIAECEVDFLKNLQRQIHAAMCCRYNEYVKYSPGKARKKYEGDVEGWKRALRDAGNVDQVRKVVASIFDTDTPHPNLHEIAVDLMQIDNDDMSFRDFVGMTLCCDPFQNRN
jgi:hypothetical protein